MGMILTEANRPQVAEYHYRRVLELGGSARSHPARQPRLEPEEPGPHERGPRALRGIRQRRAGNPSDAAGFARLEEADRDFDAAAGVLDRMDKLFPNDQGVRLTRAVLLGRMRKYDQAIELIDSTASDERKLGPNELLEKGRLLDQVGRYDDAWAAFAEGKKLARELSGQAYLDTEANQQIERLRNFFTGGRLRLMPPRKRAFRCAAADVHPGLPALRHHAGGADPVGASEDRRRRRTAADPRDHRDHAAHAGQPARLSEALAELWMGDQREGLDNLRDYYLHKVRQLGVLRDGATRFTDKMPLNETHLGLIALLFPEAPLIHVLRHPLDIMVSAFSNQFTHGFFCAYDLETAARHYVRVMDLVQHYRGEMTLRYLPIRYEDIVGDQEASVRAMLGLSARTSTGLPDVPQNRRYARTASYAQVTEPLYKRSVHRYQHYRQHLEPVIQILQPVIERLGYTVD